jgi:hypothetical protein
MSATAEHSATSFAADVALEAISATAGQDVQ